ncbi:MAG: hypothetical protein ACRD2G_05175, partial [Terriglobia bacterium]
YVGNVLGTPSAETQYQVEAFSPSGYVWQLGAEADNGGTPNDPLTVASALRWENVSVLTGDPLSNALEIPTALFAFINGNPVPGAQSLPASFYLLAQPTFWQTPWGRPPWPAIGPDVTNGNAPDGNDPGRPDNHSNAIPAQVCYSNTAVDPAYQQTYSVTGANWSPAGGGTATIYFNNGGANALVADDTVAVSGISSSGGASNFNGIFAVVSATSNSITYALGGNPGTYASGGTITYPNILLFNAANCYPAAYGGGSRPAPPTGLRATVN